MSKESGIDYATLRTKYPDLPLDQAIALEFPSYGTFEDDGEKSNPELDFPLAPVEETTWQTTIVVTAKSVNKVSQTQTMGETKIFDVTDFLTDSQLAHIIDCILPTTKI